MTDTDFNDIIQAAKVFENYQRPWAVCGGWAIDLYLNYVTRPHKDADFVILRKDQLVIQEYLLSRGWTLEKAVRGQLVPWQSGEWIDLPVHVIWCKHRNASPDFIELLFNEIDDSNFLYRRDTTITLPVEKMIISSPLGIPILTPELVLLYKSGSPEIDPLATSDFENVFPRLSPVVRTWLAAALRKANQNHVWLEALS